MTIGVDEREEPGLDSLDRTVPPEVGLPPSVRLPRAEEFTLGNGLRVVMIGHRTVPVANLTLQIRGGGWEVPGDKAGLAAFAADLLDEGTPGRSAMEIAAGLERLGAGLSSVAGRDASTLRLGVLRDRLEAALAIFADVLIRPTFPEAEVERVRAEQLTRILQGNAEPRIVADETIARVLYGPEHPYGQPVLGIRETVAALGRDDALAYYRTWYRPSEATLIVTGAVARDELVPMLEETLGDWRDESADQSRHVLPPSPPGTNLYLVDRPDAPQSEIRLGRLAAERATDDYFALTVLNTVLGGSFTSRLNTRLREEKGYTYGAWSSFALRRRVGPFVAGAAVHTPVTDSAVADFLAELGRIVEEPVPEEELERAKNYVALRLPQGFETAADLSTRIAELVLNDLPLDYYDGYVDSVLAVTADEVQAAARTYLTGGVAVLVVGDRATVEEPLRALGVGEVVVLESLPGAGKDR